MQISSLKNISNEQITVKLIDGTEISLPPNRSVFGLDVNNLNEIRSKVKVVENLTEVNVASGKTKLYD